MNLKALEKEFLFFYEFRHQKILIIEILLNELYFLFDESLSMLNCVDDIKSR